MPLLGGTCDSISTNAVFPAEPSEPDSLREAAGSLILPRRTVEGGGTASDDLLCPSCYYVRASALAPEFDTGFDASYMGCLSDTNAGADGNRLS